MSPLPRFRVYSKPRMYAAILRDVLTGHAHEGDEMGQLEEAVKHYTGAPYAVCMPKARVGVYLLVRAMVPPGKKVILSPYTISDIINMVICAGAVPVFADLERETANIDPAEIERLIDADTAAVMVTHLHGLACDMTRLAEICRRKNVLLLEDAAQAFSARWQGKPVGTFADAGVYSFGMYKNVNSFFGGMVVTPHKDTADRLRREVESFPWQETGYYLSKVREALTTDIATWPPLFGAVTFPIFRYTFLHDMKFLSGAIAVDANPVMKRTLPESYLRRYTPMQARLVLPQLADAERNSRARIENARIYYEGLRDLPELICAPFHDDLTHVYMYYVIQAPDRRALVKYLMRHGCDVTMSHHRNCADLPCFTEFHRDCPNARAVASSLIYLPAYPRYSERDVRRNVRLIREFFGAKSAPVAAEAPAL